MLLEVIGDSWIYEKHIDVYGIPGTDVKLYKARDVVKLTRHNGLPEILPKIDVFDKCRARIKGCSRNQEAWFVTESGLDTILKYGDVKIGKK